MQIDRSYSIVEQYLAYFITIKGRSKNTVIEYRLDLLQFWKYLKTKVHLLNNLETPIRVINEYPFITIYLVILSLILSLVNTMFHKFA
jgi:hypothetical protein